MTEPTSFLSADAVRALPARERVGLSITMGDPAEAVQAVVEAEQHGVRQIWATQGAASCDALTVYAVAAARTASIRMGTSILPTYPRHPLAMAAQARTVHQLAPGRLRLGIGTSHRPTIEGSYGIAMEAPLAHLAEYATVLRAALWEGKVEHRGRFFQVTATLPATARVPILVAALGTGAFQAAGSYADGAMSWNCPVQYLLDAAAPALRAGAQQTGRPVPPLVAHVPVALSTERDAVFAAARRRLAMYGRLPFYRNMFASAGYPLPEDGTFTDALLDSLVVWGDAPAIAARLNGLLAGGLDELLLMLVPVGSDEGAERAALARLIGQL